MMFMEVDMQPHEAMVLSVIVVCLTSFCGFFLWLVYKSNVRMSNFIMSLKSDKDYQMTQPSKIQKLAKDDIERMEEETDYNDYTDIMRRGFATKEEEERFGVGDGVIQ